jgi:hypothetical protein
MTKDFYGLAIHTIHNPFLTLDYLAEAGPRLVGLFLNGNSQNLLAELPDLVEKTPYGEFRFLGGHRLWHSPEAFPRTYIPDDQGLVVEETKQGVRLRGALETATGIQKTMQIELLPDSPAIKIHHEITNQGLWPVELAVWALTQLPLGGIAVFPQQTQPLDKASLLPNRQLVLWPYSRWADPRLVLGDDYIFIHAQPQLPPIKIGYANRKGWIGYLRDGVFFCKRFPPFSDANYPDFGNNVESFCNHRFIEMETLSPISKLEPGQSIYHDETWEIFPVDGIPATQEGILQVVEQLNLG